MIPLLIIICLQLFIAGIVFVVLRYLLDRELEKVAIEKLLSLQMEAVKGDICIFHGNPLSASIEERIKDLIKGKFKDNPVKFEQLKSLKGGLMIKTADQVLDFSLSSRLENFWS